VNLAQWLSHWLVQLKIHGSCPGELIDVIKQLEQATGSVAVDQIGRSVILYRPSPSKMKKREAASLRKPKEYPAFRVQKKAQAPGAYGEGRRQLRSSWDVNGGSHCFSFLTGRQEALWRYIYVPSVKSFFCACCLMAIIFVLYLTFDALLLKQH